MPEGGHRRPIEQLHYTWAPRGAEGINQFQIAAISPGLKRAPLVSLLSDLRRLCRYDGPPGSEDGPASFGWLDLGQHRVVFLRVPVAGVGGRSGSFAAHLLVGDPAAMPAAEVATCFEAGFWWTGLTEAELEAIARGKDDFELSPLDWEAALKSRVGDSAGTDSAAETLIQGLLSKDGDGRLAVLDEEGRLGPALRVLGWRFPAAIAEVSFSTFETAPVFPFALLGTLDRPRGLEVCELGGGGNGGGAGSGGRTTARELLADEAQAERLRAAVIRAGVEAGGGGSRWKVAEALVRLGADESADDEVLAREANPSALAYLTHTEAGRLRIARLVGRGATLVLAALKAARELIAPEDLDGLCDGIGDRYVESGELRGCATVLAVLAPGPGRARVEADLMRVAMRAESAEDEVGSDDAVALLRLAAARGLGVERIKPLLAASAPHIGSCAEDFAVSAETLAAMLPLARERGGGEREVCRALGRHPRLIAEGTTEIAEQERWIEFARRLRGAQLQEALPALLVGLPDAPQSDLTAWVEQTPLIPGRRALLTATRLIEARPLPRSLAGVCEMSGARAAREGDVDDARRLLAQGESPDSRTAANILAAAGASTFDQVRAAYDIARIEDHALRDAVFSTMVKSSLRRMHHLEDPASIWNLLSASYPTDDAEAILERLLRHAVQVPPASNQSLLILWLGTTLLPTFPDLTKRHLQPKNPTIADLIQALALHASDQELDSLTPLAESTPKPTPRWWKSLLTDRCKALERAAR